MDWTDQHAASPPTVLVADPDAATRAWVRSVLQEIGLGVSEVSGATELWDCVRRGKVALVLLEARLPQARTDTLVAELNRRDITVVLMSGHPQSLKKAQLPRDVVLQKPLQLRDVLRAAIVSLPTWSRPTDDGRASKAPGAELEPRYVQHE